MIDGWLWLAAALGIGLLIGAERERRKGSGPLRVAAGIRTFALAALLGAAAWQVGGASMLAAATVVIGAFGVVSYWRSRAEDPGITTGVALVLTVVLGAMAVRDMAMAAGIAVLVALLLAAKAPVHDFVRRVMTQDELDDALILGAASLVVLPMMPGGQIGPYGALNPRAIWLVVILMMVVGALAHVAQRWLGTRAGLAATGFAGGFVSATATTAHLGALSARDPGLLRAAATGALLANVATAMQMAAVLGATSPALLVHVAPSLAGAMAVAIVFVGLSLARRAGAAPAAAVLAPGRDRVLGIGTALSLGAVITVATVGIAALSARLGDRGALVASALAGLVDAHAASVSAALLLTGGQLAPVDAMHAVLVALSTNTAAKAVVAWQFGGRRFALSVWPGQAAFVLAAWAVLPLGPR